MGRKWKSVLSIAVLLAALALLSGCGKDGKPGNAYIGVWVEGSYPSDAIAGWYCAALSAPFYYGYTSGFVPYIATDYYYIPEGSWPYSYTVHISGNIYSYYGTLVITVEAGQPGSFPFIDGANGADKFYDWVLTAAGSYFFFDKAQIAKAAALPSKQKSTTEVASAPTAPDPKLYDIGPKRVITKSDGARRITITEYSYTPKATTP